METTRLSAPSVAVFRALADPTRLSLFERLARCEELSVTDLTRGAKVSQPAVSQHLASLKGVGLVRDRKVGRTMLYRADAKALRPLIDWLSYYSAFWEARIDALEQVLDQLGD